MKIYISKRDNGEVMSYAKKKFDGSITVTISDADFDKIIQGYKLKFTDKLEIEKPDDLKEKENKENLKTDIEKATTINELKIILNKLL